MALDLTSITPPSTAQTKQAPGPVRRGALVALGLLVAGVGAAAWWSGVTPRRLWETPPPALLTFDVVEGPLTVMVVENGTVESTSNTTVRCLVEALVGLVGGSTSGGNRGAAAPAATTSASAATSGLTATASLSKSASGAAATKKAATQAASKTASPSDPSSSAGSGGSGSTSSSGSGSSSSGTTPVVTVTPVPTIRSFSYTVSPYVSLQTKRAATSTLKSSGQSSGGGGGGNRGGGGGGGSGGGGTGEKQGSTRIIMIRNEGDSVSQGDVVCEFDSAAFRDAVLVQRIKTDTAKAAMIQARSILDVNAISLTEYQEGIFSQDLQLIRQYLSTCRTEQDRARRNLQWSQETLDKKFRAPQQHQADVLSMQRADIALVVAELMQKRLVEATGPKIIKSLEAKLQANRADALALEGTYRTEADRLKRLEQMVEHCTLRAPHDGTVVYSLPPSNGWRPSTATIMEGATVREGQAIYELPDPKHMQIRAKVNESKVAAIHSGQRVVIRIDAFPDRRLKGTVVSVTLIPAPAAGPGSDARVYFANIKLDEGDFEGLKPGLSAEVSFLIDNRPSIMQIPIAAIRWVGDKAFAAVSTSADRTAYRWQPIDVGVTNASHAEVVHGLAVGERIVAHPDDLPTPIIERPLIDNPTLQAAGSGSGNPKG